MICNKAIIGNSLFSRMFIGKTLWQILFIIDFWLLEDYIFGLVKNIQSSGGVFSLAVEKSLEKPTFHIRVAGFESWLGFWLQLLVNVHPGKQQRMTEVHGSLIPPWETWIQFLAPGFSLAQLRLLHTFGEWTTQRKTRIAVSQIKKKIQSSKGKKLDS